MNNLKSYFKIILLFIIIYIIFKYNYLLNISITKALYLWLNNVFPSLFIMFILNDIIIKTNLLFPFINLIKDSFNHIFNTNGLALQAFLLSIISGTPTIAFILKEMIDSKQIDELSANKLIKYTFFSNPLFLYNILKVHFKNNITIRIIIIHYITNIIIGLIYRKEKINNIDYNIQINKKKIINILPSSIKNSLDTMIMILGTISFYMIITSFLTNIICLNPIITVLIKGLMEITQGLSALNIIHTFSLLKEIIAITIISFGGFAIHTQVYTILDNSKILYINFLKGRILHAIISATTYFLITSFIS